MRRFLFGCITLLCFLGACSREDPVPAEPVLQDGVWTGTGEGRSCDLVVVGDGGAGLTAAVEAASGGDLRIVVLEKQGIPWWLPADVSLLPLIEKELSFS